MAGHLTPLAKAAADAVKAGRALKGAADDLYAELGPTTETKAIDIGAGVYLIARPGYGPLSDPTDFLDVAHLAS